MVATIQPTIAAPDGGALGIGPTFRPLPPPTHSPARWDILNGSASGSSAPSHICESQRPKEPPPRQEEGAREANVGFKAQFREGPRGDHPGRPTSKY